MRQYQQGDVLFIGVGAIPKGAKAIRPTKQGRYVLREGEATGHAHTVAASGTELLEQDGIMYLVADMDTIVQHEEHKPVALPKGIYAIGPVVEEDPFADEVRAVAD